MKKKMDYRLKGIITALILFSVVLMLVFAASTARAQSIVRQGNTFIEQIDTTKTKKKCQVYESDYLYCDKDGQVYTVYLSSNGNAFIVKVSKKSGKKYRKYLPEVTKMLIN